MAYYHLKESDIRRYCIDVFMKSGYDQKQSEDITDVVLMADLYGIESHGVQRMIRYHNSLQKGFVDTEIKPSVVHETKISCVLDAKKSIGQLTAKYAMQKAIDMAKEYGFGTVTVRNCNHFGIASYYSRMAAEQDLLGFSSCNTEAIGVPTFGKKAMLGTSPLSVCMPADPYHFMYDVSTTIVTRGKLEVYNKNNDPIPESWAADEFGNPCSDPKRVLDNINQKNNGGIFPLGGATFETGSHKGYGLGIIADMVTGVFAGGHTSPHVQNGGMSDTSFGFMAIDYGIYGDKKEIRDNMSTFLRELRESPRANEDQPIYTHGQLEMISMEDKLKNGVPVNENTYKEFEQIASDLGMNIGEYFDIK